MKIMLTGANGQVGWELSRSLMPLGEVIALTRTQCDLSRPETIPRIVQEIKPDLIVNAAGYTAVDKAEEEEALATTINGTAVGVLAEQAKKRNALLVHFSTDYVFDGTKPTPYTEEDEPNPINAYGRSKLAGEKNISHVGCNYLVFRCGWIFAARRNNFPLTILKMALKPEPLNVVCDSFGAPTSAALIADITATLIYKIAIDPVPFENASNIYHLSASGETNWYEYAKVLVELAHDRGFPLKVGPDQIVPVSRQSRNSIAKRPNNSRLGTLLLSEQFGFSLPRWNDLIVRLIEELAELRDIRM